MSGLVLQTESGKDRSPPVSVSQSIFLQQFLFPALETQLRGLSGGSQYGAEYAPAEQVQDRLLSSKIIVINLMKIIRFSYMGSATKSIFGDSFIANGNGSVNFTAKLLICAADQVLHKVSDLSYGRFRLRQLP